MKVKIIKMYDDVKTPVYATKGSACFDIFAYRSEGAFPDNEILSTGLKVEVPEGHALMIYSRSGHGFNQDIRLANCVGVIDSDYRGEIKIKLTKDSRQASYLNVHEGDRIAQGMLIPIEQVEFEVVSELSDSDRGEGGFGSTGSK